MLCNEIGTNHTQTVHFIKEVAPTPWRNNRINILEDEQTGRHIPRLLEDITNVPSPGRRLDIQTGNRVAAYLEKRVHQRFDRDGFSVSSRAVEYDLRKCKPMGNGKYDLNIVRTPRFQGTPRSL